MNTRVTIGLLVLCIALGIYLYVVPAPSNDPAPEVDTSVPVLTFDSRQVMQMDVQNASGQVLQVARNGDNWDIVTDTRVAGDTIVIGPMVANVAALRATSVITPEGDTLADYGLQAPQLTVTLHGESAPLATLFVGARNPSGGARYVQVAGESRVFLVSDVTLDTIERWYDALPIAPTPLPTLMPTVAP